MATIPTTEVPGLRYDPEGKWVLFTAEEAKIRGVALRAALEKINESGDDDPELDAQIFRAIDSHRPERRLFDEILRP